MAERVIMPKLGFDMAEGTLVKWVIPEGDAVSKGQVLAEIETDKATVEVESTFSGVLRKYLVNEGDVVPVGDPIAEIAAPGETADDAPEGGINEPDVTAPPKDEVEMRVTPKPGQEEEARKDVEAQIEAQGDEGPSIKVTEPQPDSQEQPQPEHEKTGDGQLPDGVRASPVARRMAEEKDLDLRQIQGTGPGGRITRKDIESVLTQPAQPKAAEPSPAVPEQKTVEPVTAPTAWTPPGPPPEDEKQTIGRLRAAIGRRMTESKQQVPHFYVTSEYDVEALMDLRKQLNQYLPDDQKISVNDFIIKAVALALRQFPNLNASITGNEIVRHGRVNVGVAVAVEGGLLTVVSQDTDQKPLRVISTEVREMVARARSGKVRTEDIEGSTFSVSNLGMFDVEHFVAIINPPEAAILAIGSVQQKPVVVDGEIKVGTRMQATLSADHRVTDGAEGAQFMQVMREFLEEPYRLVL